MSERPSSPKRNNLAMAARQSGRRGGWLHKPASGLEGDGLADTSQSCRGADSHYHSLAHRHKHDTRSPMLGVREAEHRSTRMRYSISAAGAGRPLCSETSSRPPTLCCVSVSGRGEGTGTEGLARAPTGATAPRPHRQLALACDRRADAIGLACFYGNQTLGRGHDGPARQAVQRRWRIVVASVVHARSYRQQSSSLMERRMRCQ